MTAKKNREALHLKKWFNSSISWDDVIKEINIAYEVKSSDFKDYNFVWDVENRVAVRDLFYIQLLSEMPSRIDIVNTAAKQFSEIFYPDGSNSPAAAQMFINLIGKDSSVEIHNDDWDVCFVHLLGEAEWTIHKSLHETQPIQKFDVQPGDVLLIPKGVYHSIHAKTPRFGVSLGFPDKDSSTSKHDKS